MKSVSLRSKLNIQDREFQIHTGSYPDRSMILSEVFEEGQFVTSKKIPFQARNEDDPGSNLDFLKSVASKLHHDTLEEVNMLFYVHSKIRPLKNYLPHFRLASVLYDKNIIPEAIENFETAIELKNDYITAYSRLGKCFIKSAHYKKAIDIFKRGLELQPEFPDLANSLGVAYTLEGDYSNATVVLQQAIKNNPKFDEASFNLGVALFRSTLEESDNQEKAFVPSRVIRFIGSLQKLDRYKDSEWQEAFGNARNIIQKGDLKSILESLEKLQLKLITHLKIDTAIESFYLKFMYGGRELDYSELEDFENRILQMGEERENFADYWNELGTIHIIQCRHLFLKSLDEFEKAVEANKNYEEAKKNLDLIKNIKKGFLILLRAVLK